MLTPSLGRCLVVELVADAASNVDDQCIVELPQVVDRLDDAADPMISENRGNSISVQNMVILEVRSGA
jgi:hypothetical protein